MLDTSSSFVKPDRLATVDGETCAPERRKGVVGVLVFLETLQLRHTHVLSGSTEHVQKRPDHEAARSWHPQESTSGTWEKVNNN